MGHLVPFHVGVPPALVPAHLPHCCVIKGSVGPLLIFPDPFPVPDHEAVVVQAVHLVSDPPRTALQFANFFFSKAILFCTCPFDPVSLDLLAQALAVVLQVLVVADLKASQIWGWGCGTTVPQSSTIWELYHTSAEIGENSEIEHAC